MYWSRDGLSICLALEHGSLGSLLSCTQKTRPDHGAGFLMFGVLMYYIMPPPIHSLQRPLCPMSS